MFSTATDVSARCCCPKITGINTQIQWQKPAFITAACPTISERIKYFMRTRATVLRSRACHHLRLGAHERRACFRSGDAGKTAPPSAMQVGNKTKTKEKKIFKRILKSKAAMQSHFRSDKENASSLLQRLSVEAPTNGGCFFGFIPSFVFRPGYISVRSKKELKDRGAETSTFSPLQPITPAWFQSSLATGYYYIFPQEVRTALISL